ncbi:hypothetical protein Poly51_40800 [Rubripirellula tenax]|uniref:Uncharacterized protein n=1 Tax=Rubripirellula tenax TaxID=2528015 RepID=A0A5C6ERS7_9BACT|nr:hypothetical protein [Rubripirellula tenax]TWU50787.1 hypothetical protein Poly51_40800 [Rubripirellula tenax]
MSLSNHLSNVDVSAVPFAVGDSSFVDRRSIKSGVSARSERRQFGSSHMGLSEDGRELAQAIDQYKLQHHRRYLTCDEMLTVLTALGYAKTGQ